MCNKMNNKLKIVHKMAIPAINIGYFEVDHSFYVICGSFNMIFSTGFSV